MSKILFRSTGPNYILFLFFYRFLYRTLADRQMKFSGILFNKVCVNLRVKCIWILLRVVTGSDVKMFCFSSNFDTFDIYQRLAVVCVTIYKTKFNFFSYVFVLVRTRGRWPLVGDLFSLYNYQKLFSIEL